MTLKSSFWSFNQLFDHLIDIKFIFFDLFYPNWSKIIVIYRSSISTLKSDSSLNGHPNSDSLESKSSSTIRFVGPNCLSLVPSTKINIIFKQSARSYSTPCCHLHVSCGEFFHTKSGVVIFFIFKETKFLVNSNGPFLTLVAGANWHLTKLWHNR